jgi:hypothetical protein
MYLSLDMDGFTPYVNNLGPTIVTIICLVSSDSFQQLT